MGRGVWFKTKASLTATLACACLGATVARSEPVTDRVLSHYQLASKNGCMILKINFNIRIRYISHFPLDHGDQLRIIVRPIDPQVAAIESVTARESLRPPENNAAALQSIVFRGSGAGRQGAVAAFRAADGIQRRAGTGFREPSRRACGWQARQGLRATRPVQQPGLGGRRAPPGG